MQHKTNKGTNKLVRVVHLIGKIPVLVLQKLVQLPWSIHNHNGLVSQLYIPRRLSEYKHPCEYPQQVRTNIQWQAANSLLPSYIESESHLRNCKQFSYGNGTSTKCFLQGKLYVKDEGLRIDSNHNVCLLWLEQPLHIDHEKTKSLVQIMQKVRNFTSDI